MCQVLSTPAFHHLTDGLSRRRVSYFKVASLPKYIGYTAYVRRAEQV